MSTGGSENSASQAVHNDFFTISGASLPTDVVIEFDTPALTVTITPDLVRPDWVFVAQLATSVPTGKLTVRLHSPSTGYTSNAIPIDVSAKPPAFVRRLYTGSPKDAPYTIA